MIPDWLIPSPADRDQADRLAVFRAAYPAVVIGSGGFGTWQAVITEGSRETVKGGDTLGELLDKLDEMFPPGREAPPGGNQPGDPSG